MTKKQFVNLLDKEKDKLNKIRILMKLKTNRVHDFNFGLKQAYDLVTENNSGEKIYTKLPSWYKNSLKAKKI
jgi:hypothetical protein